MECVMKYSSRFLILLCGVLLVAGCSGRMVSLWETEYPHPIQDTISKEQVRESIFEGASNAGWVAKDQGNSTILATYQIRIHTVHVNIYYSDEYYFYRIKYESSIAMKMRCSKKDKGYIVSGNKYCPGSRLPYSINANYKIWIDSLIAAIESSLATKQQN